MGFRVSGLTKSYAGVPVLKNVNLAVEDGEIHALLGANGAGKSTLIKCVSGAVQPESGEVVLGNDTYTALTPAQARLAGVSVIYQELSLATMLNVYENVFLGQELRWGPVVRRRRERAEAERWLRELGVNAAADAPLSSLSNAELQVIEIAKALRGSPTVVILDEPTASLTEREAEQLRAHMLSLRKQNLPLLYVTHRLGEVFRFADRVTVLRGGEVVLSGIVEELTADDLVTAIAGRSFDRERGAAVAARESAQPLLCTTGLVSPGVGPIDLDVQPGEIVGVFGLVGSGRTELLETLFGARRAHRGTIEVNGRRTTLRSCADAVASGLALVPSDRLRKSVLPSLSASENILLPSFGRFARLGWRRRRAERARFEEVATRLNLQPRRPHDEARRFSGGNQQKLVLGRWLAGEGEQCQVLMLDEPTQGVDVGARSDLYEGLRHFAGAGRGVLVTSSEPEELMQLAHRVVVLSRGRVTGVLSGDDVDEVRLLELAHLAEEVGAA